MLDFVAFVAALICYFFAFPIPVYVIAIYLFATNMMAYCTHVLHHFGWISWGVCTLLLLFLLDMPYWEGLAYGYILSEFTTTLRGLIMFGILKSTSKSGK